MQWNVALRSGPVASLRRYHRQPRTTAANRSGAAARITLGGSDRRLGGPWVRSFAQPVRAGFALAIADRCQGRGLGRVLLGWLVEAALSVGIGWLTAEVLAENHRMLNLLGHAQYPISLRLSSGVVLAELATSPSPGPGLIPRRLSSVAA